MQNKHFINILRLLFLSGTLRLDPFKESLSSMLDQQTVEKLIMLWKDLSILSLESTVVPSSF